MMHTIVEECPHCEQEVVLVNKFVPQWCSFCGEKILPCSICKYLPYVNHHDCTDCPLKKNDAMDIRANEKDGLKYMMQLYCEDCGKYVAATGTEGSDGSPPINWTCNKCGGRNLHPIAATPEPIKKEAVNHPSHYNVGKIEVIDIIEDWECSFCLGNVIKYVLRAPHKDKELEDLKKARWYLDREIARIGMGPLAMASEIAKDAGIAGKQLREALILLCKIDPEIIPCGSGIDKKPQASKPEVK